MAPPSDVPPDWRSLTVDALALERKGAIKIGPFGSQLKKNELKEQGIRVFGQENVIQNDFGIGERFIDHAKFDTLRSVQLFPGDVVLTMMGSLGAATVVPHGTPTGVMDSHLLRIQPDTSLVEPEFLARVLRDSAEIKKQILARSQGGIMSGLNAKIVRTLEVPIPPLLEQRKIAAILSSVDDAIEKTQAVIDQVQVVKRGLMQELLTRGLPGRHTRFKQTAIGEIPEEWDLRPAIAICERIVVGIVIKPAQYYTAAGVPCLRSLNVMEDQVANRDMRYISHESNHLLRKSRLRAGDVVTVRTGYPGRSAVIPPQWNGANCVDLIISTPGPCIRGAFLSRFINSDRGRAAVTERKGGLAQQHFNVGAMKALLVPIPSLEEQDRIGDILRSTDSRLQSETTFSSNLLSLKSALMSVLLTGEVRVDSEADAARLSRPPRRSDAHTGG